MHTFGRLLEFMLKTPVTETVETRVDAETQEFAAPCGCKMQRHLNRPGTFGGDVTITYIPHTMTDDPDDKQGWFKSGEFSDTDAIELLNQEVNKEIKESRRSRGTSPYFPFPLRYVPGTGRGRGLGRGLGRGRMGGPFAAGPGGSCVCPNCGETVPHIVGQPCNQRNCPKCGTKKKE